MARSQNLPSRLRPLPWHRMIGLSRMEAAQHLYARCGNSLGHCEPLIWTGTATSWKFVTGAMSGSPYTLQRSEGSAVSVDSIFPTVPSQCKDIVRSDWLAEADVSDIQNSDGDALYMSTDGTFGVKAACTSLHGTAALLSGRRRSRERRAPMCGCSITCLRAWTFIALIDFNG